MCGYREVPPLALRRISLGCVLCVLGRKRIKSMGGVVPKSHEITVTVNSWTATQCMLGAVCKTTWITMHNIPIDHLTVCCATPTNDDAIRCALSRFRRGQLIVVLAPVSNCGEYTRQIAFQMCQATRVGELARYVQCFSCEVKSLRIVGVDAFAPRDVSQDGLPEPVSNSHNTSTQKQIPLMASLELLLHACRAPVLEVGTREIEFGRLLPHLRSCLHGVTCLKLFTKQNFYDNDFAYFAHFAHHLESLILMSNWFEESDWDSDEVSSRSTRPRPRKSVFRPDRMTPRVLTTIATECPRLHTLDLNGVDCAFFYSGATHLRIPSMPALRVLRIACSTVPVHLGWTVAQNPGLKLIDVSYCPPSDTHVAWFARNYKQQYGTDPQLTLVVKRERGRSVCLRCCHSRTIEGVQILVT
jgi:hypothetical protein